MVPLQKVKEVTIGEFEEELSGFQVEYEGKRYCTDEFFGNRTVSFILDDDEVIVGFKSRVYGYDVHDLFQFIIMRDIEAWDL